MADSIRDQMEGWARWRASGFRQFGYGKTILQRVLEGMPGTGCPTCGTKGRVPGSLVGSSAPFVKCPTCSGHGRVPLDASDHKINSRPCPHCRVKNRSSGEVHGRTCIPCRGSGTLVTETDKVNPAFITSTYREPDHPTYQRIDRLVCELRRRNELKSYWFVVDAEYCDRRGGTQAMKALRMGMPVSRYLLYLRQAHDIISYGLSVNGAVSEVAFQHA
jgi:hypothetical protein